MNLGGNTVLVTGGASGIGLAIARRFLDAGSEVVICGRRKEKLEEARSQNPGFKTRVADVSTAEGRQALARWAATELPKLNVLVNNAGIQRRVDLLKGEPWEQTREELAINLEAPIHLTQLFLPQLLGAKAPAILNVTSGLAFSPLANVPVYCATKAALRSFTLSLRHQLAKTPVRVIEIIPPAVNTDLGGPGLHTFGANVDEFADSVMKRVAEGLIEVAYGFSENALRASREELDKIFQRMNAPQAH